MMINAEPLKHYLEIVAQTERAWQAEAATAATEQNSPGSKFADAERAYLTACAQLASAVACEVKATLQTKIVESVEFNLGRKLTSDEQQYVSEFTEENSTPGMT